MKATVAIRRVSSSSSSLRYGLVWAGTAGVLSVGTAVAHADPAASATTHAEAAATSPPTDDDDNGTDPTTTRKRQVSPSQSHDSVGHRTIPSFSSSSSSSWWPWSTTARNDWRAAFDAQAHDLQGKRGYRAMPEPETVMHPSHALTGALLKERHVERYRIYQKRHDDDDGRHDPRQRCAEAAASSEPQVVALVRVGSQVDGHEGLVHGGILAMLVDDVLGYGFYAVGWPAAFTANLSIDYRAPVPAETTLRIECYFEKLERRKLYWRIRVVEARPENSFTKPKLYADATSLYVIPKQVYEKVLQTETPKSQS